MPMQDGVTEHRWLDAVRRTGIGAQHVSVNTQEFLDQNFARCVELGVIVGEQPVAWIDPLGIQLDRGLEALLVTRE